MEIQSPIGSRIIPAGTVAPRIVANLLKKFAQLERIVLLDRQT
jgi:hypothetical protein